MFDLQLLKFPLLFMYLAACVNWLLIGYLIVAVLVYTGEAPRKVISGTRSEYLLWRKRDLKHRRVLKVYLKFWVENLFNLYGLEINLIALLLASFALLNAISMLIIALLAACVLFLCTDFDYWNSRIWYFASWLACLHSDCSFSCLSVSFCGGI